MSRSERVLHRIKLRTAFMEGAAMAKNVPVKVKISEHPVSVSRLKEALQKIHMEVVYGIIQSDQYSDQQAAEILKHMLFLLSEEPGKRMEKERRSVGI